MRSLLALLMLLGACGMDESYSVDGVPVVLERGAGPEKEQMTFAAHLFRSAAETYWSLTSEEEMTTWRSIGQIRWTSSPVADGADYDAQLNVLSANWRGCVLAVPFYQALQFVYADEVSTEDLEWARELERDSDDAVCLPSESRFRAPW